MKNVFVLVSLMLLFISGCGNGGGQSEVLGTIFPNPGTVTGVASDGELITGKRVRLKDAKGKSAEDVLSDNTTGFYSIDVTGLTAPFLVTVIGANGTYLALAPTTGTANINPITTMTVALAAGGSDMAALFAGLTPAQLATINYNYAKKTFLVTESLIDALPAGVAISDYLTGTITADNGRNDFFATYRITTDPLTGIIFRTTDAAGITVLNIPVATIAAGSNEPLPVLANVTPVAKAGAAQNVAVDTTVTLDGSGSYDSNRDTLTYNWVLTSRPNGSSAELSSATDVKPTFTADVAGNYVCTLIVNDGKVNSAASTVTITVFIPNVAPVANAGPDQAVNTGTLVTLDGSGSTDENGDTLTYAWSLMTVPNGSTAALSSTTNVKPTFTPDVAGSYVISLSVNDGTAPSALADIVTITATAPTPTP